MPDSNKNAEDQALENLLALIEDYHDFNPGEIQVIDHILSSVEFSKQVSKGLPCVWSVDTLPDWQISRHWTRERLCELVAETVEVATTPDGRADSLCSLPGSPDHKVFLQPANRDMSMREFLNLLDADRQTDDPVCYLQSQNSNLTSTPLQALLQDLPKNFSLAEEVLGEPEAVNLWIGDERSVTSTHRDPYENMYVVLRGSKTFTLWPPVDEICMDGR
jgi:jumonji domain-containing protein 7